MILVGSPGSLCKKRWGITVHRAWLPCRPLNLHPLDLVQYMSCLAALQLLTWLYFSGELGVALADLIAIDAKDTSGAQIFGAAV